MNELPTTLAAATLAKLLGLSTRRIQQLVEAGVIPKPGKRGEYKLVESVAGYLKWLRSDAGNGTPDFQKERARLTAARARLAEIAADRESGLVVEVEESIRQIREEYSIVRNRLLAIPSRAAPRLLNMANPEKVRALLDAEIRDTLTALMADDAKQNSASVAAHARARKISRGSK